MSMILASLGPTPQRQTVDVPALNKQRLQLGFCGKARVLSTALKVGEGLLVDLQRMQAVHAGQRVRYVTRRAEPDALLEALLIVEVPRACTSPPIELPVLRKGMEVGIAAIRDAQVRVAAVIDRPLSRFICDCTGHCIVASVVEVGWVEENAGQVLLWLDDPVSEETLVVSTHSHDVPHTGGRLADAIWEVCRKAILHGSYKRLVRKLGD